MQYRFSPIAQFAGFLYNVTVPLVCNGNRAGLPAFPCSPFILERFMPSKHAESEIIAPLLNIDHEQSLTQMEDYLSAVENLIDQLSPSFEEGVDDLREDANYLRIKIEESRLANEELARARAAHAKARIQYTLEVERYITMQMQVQLSNSLQAKQRRFQH